MSQLRTRLFFCGGIMIACALPTAAGQDGLYFTKSNTIRRVHATRVVDLAPAFTAVSLALDPDRGRMYWGNAQNGLIERSNLDGSDVESFFDFEGFNSINGLAINESSEQLYFTRAEGVNKQFSAIERINLDGTGYETLIGFNRHADGAPRHIALDVASGFMYWTDGNGNGRIRRSDLDGNNTQTLISDIGLISPEAIALDTAGGKMYWVDRNLGAVTRANLDGSSVEHLIVGLRRPYGLALDLDDGRVYWSDLLDGTIESANLDGSDRVLMPIGSQRSIQDMEILGSVPEPASMILMLTGFLALARRR